MNTEELLFNLMMFLIAYLIIFVVTYFYNNWKLKSRKKREIGEVTYLLKKFSLDEQKLSIRSMLLWISIFDAFIISFVGTFIILLPVSFIWQLLIGFVLLFALIYAIFELYGRYLVKKGYQKERRNRK